MVRPRGNDGSQRAVEDHFANRGHQNQLMSNNTLLYRNDKPQTEITTHVAVVYFSSNGRVVGELDLAFNRKNSHIKVMLVFNRHPNHKTMMNIEFMVVHSSIGLNGIARVGIRVMSYQFEYKCIVFFVNSQNDALLVNVKQSLCRFNDIHDVYHLFEFEYGLVQDEVQNGLHAYGLFVSIVDALGSFSDDIRSIRDLFLFKLNNNKSIIFLIVCSSVFDIAGEYSNPDDCSQYQYEQQPSFVNIPEYTTVMAFGSIVEEENQERLACGLDSEIIYIRLLIILGAGDRCYLAFFSSANGSVNDAVINCYRSLISVYGDYLGMDNSMNVMVDGAAIEDGARLSDSDIEMVMSNESNSTTSVAINDAADAADADADAADAIDDADADADHIMKDAADDADHIMKDVIDDAENEKLSTTVTSSSSSLLLFSLSHLSLIVCIHSVGTEGDIFKDDAEMSCGRVSDSRLDIIDQAVINHGDLTGMLVVMVVYKQYLKFSSVRCDHLKFNDICLKHLFLSLGYGMLRCAGLVRPHIGDVVMYQLLRNLYNEYLCGLLDDNPAAKEQLILQISELCHDVLNCVDCVFVTLSQCGVVSTYTSLHSDIVFVDEAVKFMEMEYMNVLV
ncbi:hypothetical protein ACJ72_07132 [Emergomyces africanus]|uniref:Uncharacterized protein n=1 Tax=Emergomyces africanus TaxID=1955775 RepID=A0A1B7NP56_9EURO|nr:hypothetical protein ACJ72_07132 [Emergomyces africanus]